MHNFPSPEYRRCGINKGVYVVQDLSRRLNMVQFTLNNNFKNKGLDDIECCITSHLVSLCAFYMPCSFGFVSTCSLQPNPSCKLISSLQPLVSCPCIPCGLINLLVLYLVPWFLSILVGSLFRLSCHGVVVFNCICLWLWMLFFGWDFCLFKFMITVFQSVCFSLLRFFKWTLSCTV